MQAILFDLDGVIYVGDQLIEGAVEALQWCDANALPYVFVTNTTSRPVSAIAAKLRAFGIDTGESRIISPPVAAVQWLKEHGLERVALYVTENTAQSFAEFRRVDNEKEGVEAVIAGDMGALWNFETMNRAFRQLMRSPPPVLIALGMTRYWLANDGMRLDTGPFIAALHYASGIEPVVLGKPSPLFFHAALQRLGVDAREAVMIGDDIKTDIGGAQQAGLSALLVRTGKFRAADLHSPITPDGVLDSIADLPAWWRGK